MVVSVVFFRLFSRVILRKLKVSFGDLFQKVDLIRKKSTVLKACAALSQPWLRPVALSGNENIENGNEKIYFAPWALS